MSVCENVHKIPITSGHFVTIIRFSDFCRFQGSVGHCLIYKENNKYGFTPQHCAFNDINLLVEHYGRESLREHNPKLDVKLLHPVNKESAAAGQQNLDNVLYLRMNQN